MAIKDMAFFKLIGSVVKKTKDKIVGTGVESESSRSDESVKDTLKAVISKGELQESEVVSDTELKTDVKQKPQATIKRKSKEKTTETKPKTTKKSTTKATTKRKTATKSKAKADSKDSTSKTTKKTATTEKKKTSAKKETKKTTPSKTENTKDKEIKKTATKTTKVKPKTTTKKSEKEETKSGVKKATTKKSRAKAKEPVKTTTKKSTTIKTATTGTKREEKIKLYAKDIKKHYGSIDDSFLAVIVKNLGPSIYRKDAELVGCSDPKELDTVRRNFLIKKLGFDKSENEMLDNEIKKVCETLKGTRTKYRATFYYILAKNLKRESALS